MTFSVILYGNLKGEKESNSIELEPDRYSKISDVLKELGISESEISHIFLDYKYSKLDDEITVENRRLALFPEDMALLYKWYF